MLKNTSRESIPWHRPFGSVFSICCFGPVGLCHSENKFNSVVAGSSGARSYTGMRKHDDNSRKIIP